MIYDGIIWKNKPKVSSPINASNLEVMDTGLVVVNNEVNSINNDLYKSEQIIEANWAVGIYPNSGNYDSSILYAIATLNKTQFNHDVTLKIADGYAIAICYYYENGGLINRVAWKTKSYTIPADSIFTLSIRVHPQDTSLIADVDTYKQQVKIDTFRAGYDALEADVEDEEFEHNISFSIVTGEVAKKNGVIVTNASYDRTDYIPVYFAEKINITSGDIYDVVCYTADKLFISTILSPSNNTWYNLPNSTVYVIISAESGKLNNTIAKISGEGLKKAVAGLTMNVFDTIYGSKPIPLGNIHGVTMFPGNLVKPQDCTDNVIVDYSNGRTQSNPGYFITGFIPVTAGTTYKGNYGRNVAYYDAELNYVSGVSGNVVKDGLTIPSGVSFTRYNIRKNADTTDPFKVYFTTASSFDPTISIDGLINENWVSGKRINWLGDSIVAGADFDEMVSSALGMIETDYGINGSTVALKADGTDRRNACCLRYSSMTDNTDIVAVSIGTNDWMYAWCPVGDISSTENTTFYGALKTLCEGLINKYPQKTIFFTTPIKRAQAFESGNGGEYTPDGVMTTPFSKNKYGYTLEDYANIIKEVCGYYSIPVLDMYRESMLNPHLTSQQDMFDSALTHPNDAGRRMMAKRICGWITQLGYTFR